MISAILGFIEVVSTLLRASCLKLEISEFGCYEAKIEEVKKAGSRTKDTSGLSLQCSATEP